MPSPGSVQWMTSMNCFLRKSRILIAGSRESITLSERALFQFPRTGACVIVSVYGQETAAPQLAGGEEALPAESERYRHGQASRLWAGRADSSSARSQAEVEAAREILGARSARG